ncbi:DUF3592 domain-containing protein [Streptomyces sp. NPDC059900]|uniref:DUF3592 domain-containing protein n=1 Tax=Streptomyces sp. NPDC059900 TaxID=3155816 RepID=UPI003432B6B2
MRFRVRGWGAGQWVTFGAIAFGSLFLAIGLILTWVSVSYLASGERARGTVVSMEWRSDGGSGKRRANDGPTAYPVVQFTAADGKSRTFEGSTGSNPPAYDLMERVEVLYRADSPGDARINSFTSMWLLPLIFGGIGLLIGGIGVTVAIVRRRRPPRTAQLTKSPAGHPA